MNYELHHGDCLDVMPTFPDNTFTAIVTDPPYGLGETPDIAELMQQWITEGHADMGKGFMGRKWDVVPGPVYWREMYRIAKPGAYLLAMCGTRTVDLMSIAIRFGGWVKFDEISYHMGQGLPPMLDWVTGMGFPKSAAIDKLIDATLGAAGAYGNYKSSDHAIKRKPGNERMHEGYQRPWRDNPEIEDRNARQYLAATPEAAQFAGYGTALKPSHEIILCFRKPVDKGYANNALTHGCGGLNIDACRVGTADDLNPNDYDDTKRTAPKFSGILNGGREGQYRASPGAVPNGRWPANLIWDGSPEVKAEFDKAGVRTSGGGWNGKYAATPNRAMSGANTARTIETPYAGDTGSAARFFTVCPPDVPRFVYMAKASSSERNEGMEYDNGHPTVKPVSLMSWLCRLVRQPANNLILDPFGGSGTTGVGALREGCDVVVIEREAEYIPIIRQRLDHYEAAVNMEPVKIKGKANDTADLPLFA
jgi:site-specific DNA-methyltransferase (adenine-specific)